MRFLAAIVGFVLTSASLPAQQASIPAQQTDRARTLLRSSLPVEKAWGAYLAARLHSDDLNRLLIEEFRASAPLRDGCPTQKR